MKKEKFNFKDLKGTLSREEMKKIKGGDYVYCQDCKATESDLDCYNRLCVCGPNCWINQGPPVTQLCQCCGPCI
jgi:hypothetical protein